MKNKVLLLTIGAIILVCLAGVLFFWISEKESPEELKLGDFPEVFKKGTAIVVGENASQIEKESAEAIAEKEKFLFGYASAVALLPHSVVNHTKGENGADFRIDMYDWNALEWNASMNNTGNVTLTNIKIIVDEKVIQLIPELKVNEKKDLLILQPYEFPLDYMLYIVCDQEAREEIRLSHTVGDSHCFFEFSWYTLPGLTLCILGIIGGILTRKRKKLLIPFTIIFFIGILLIVTLSYVCLPA